jgi:hypothetical protein
LAQAHYANLTSAEKIVSSAKVESRKNSGDLDALLNEIDD